MNERPSLRSLAEKYSADKLYSHSYIPIYEELFKGMNVRRVLEIGIGYEGLMTPFVPRYVHGASLRMWAEYWPEAWIYGCDIREDTMFDDHPRIRTLVCDQSSTESLRKMAEEIGGDLFDVVIDDGSHQYEHQWLTANVLLPHVAEGGVYIIEDTYADKGAQLAKEFGGSFICGNKRADDCLMIVRKEGSTCLI